MTCPLSIKFWHLSRQAPPAQPPCTSFVWWAPTGLNPLSLSGVEVTIDVVGEVRLRDQGSLTQGPKHRVQSPLLRLLQPLPISNLSILGRLIFEADSGWGRTSFPPLATAGLPTRRVTQAPTTGGISISGGKGHPGVLACTTISIPGLETKAKRRLGPQGR